MIRRAAHVRKRFGNRKIGVGEIGTDSFVKHSLGRFFARIARHDKIADGENQMRQRLAVFGRLGVDSPRCVEKSAQNLAVGNYVQPLFGNRERRMQTDVDKILVAARAMDKFGRNGKHGIFVKRKIAVFGRQNALAVNITHQLPYAVVRVRGKTADVFARYGYFVIHRHISLRFGLFQYNRKRRFCKWTRQTILWTIRRFVLCPFTPPAPLRIRGAVGRAYRHSLSVSGVWWNISDMIEKGGFNNKEELIATAIENKLIVTTLRDTE